ncbi:MAG TPA: transcriptional coactivator p15 [Deltaproteobacteria bacterium]|nr:transcriptional coactivator p15 [Deltaproteobacteria bacterium]
MRKSEVPMVVGQVERNEAEVLRISTEEFKGRAYVDVRIYFADNEGEWKPTKKGVTINPDKVDQVIELLREAQEKLKG